MRLSPGESNRSINENTAGRSNGISRHISTALTTASLALAACTLPGPRPSIETVAADICADGIQGTVKPIKGAPKNNGFAAVLDERTDRIHADFWNQTLTCSPATGVVPHAMAGHLLDSKAYLTTAQWQKWPRAYTFTPKGEQELNEVRADAKWLDLPDSLGMNENLYSVFLMVGNELDKPVPTEGVEDLTERTRKYEEVISESFPPNRIGKNGCVTVGFVKTLQGLSERPYAPYLYVLDQGAWAYGGTPLTVESFLKGMEGAKECELPAPVEPKKPASPTKLKETSARVMGSIDARVERYKRLSGSEEVNRNLQ